MESETACYQANGPEQKFVSKKVSCLMKDPDASIKWIDAFFEDMSVAENSTLVSLGMGFGLGEIGSGFLQMVIEDNNDMAAKTNPFIFPSLGKD